MNLLFSFIYIKILISLSAVRLLLNGEVFNFVLRRINIMICSICKKNVAVLHIKDIFMSDSDVEPEENEVHVCKECVSINNIYEKYIKLDESIIVDDNPPKVKKERLSSNVICQVCGYALGEFRNTNRLSCPACYKHFFNDTLKVIKKIHFKSWHVGRLPYEERILSEKARNKKRLEDRLNKCVLEENYEEAGAIRDAIKNLEKN